MSADSEEDGDSTRHLLVADDTHQTNDDDVGNASRATDRLLGDDDDVDDEVDDDDEVSIVRAMQQLVASEQEKLERSSRENIATDDAQAGTSQSKNYLELHALNNEDNKSNISDVSSAIHVAPHGNIPTPELGRREHLLLPVSSVRQKPIPAAILERSRLAQKLLKKHASETSKCVSGLFIIMLIFSLAAGNLFLAYWFHIDDLLIVGAIFAGGGIFQYFVHCCAVHDQGFRVGLFGSLPTTIMTTDPTRLYYFQDLKLHCSISDGDENILPIVVFNLK